MNKIIKVNTIEDLENLEPPARKEFINFILNADFGEELADWINKISRLKTYHENTIVWNAPRRSIGFHPSSIYADCDFKLYCDYIGAPSNRKINNTEQLIFDTGTVLHKQLDYYYSTMAEFNSGWEYKHDINFSLGRFSIVGSADGIMIRNNEEYEYTLLHEYKSINTASFSKLNDIKYIENNYKRYIYQIQTYMACLRIPFALLVFISKNDSRIRIYMIPFDKTLWKQISTKLDWIVNSKEPIAKTKNVYSCEKYCEYYQFCDPYNSLNGHKGNKKL
jgi:hypothetical protein